LPVDPKQRAVLEIPEGAVFELEQDGLVLGFRDDVIIRGNISHRIKKIFSENGNIELRSPSELVVETVETKKGQVIIAGAVRAKSVKGMKISLLEGHLSARSVNAEQQINLQGGTIEADLVMSPDVQVSQTVRGRATVIESQNELGPHALKGGFKMAEFLEMMPSAQKVIQSEASGMPQLMAARPAPAAAAAAAAAAAPAPAAPHANGNGQTWTATVKEAAEETAPVSTMAADGGASEEATAAPAGEEAAAVGSDWGEEAAPAAPAVVERPPFHAGLAEMCEQIARVYEQQKFAVPPPVQRLIDLVETGEYASVKGQLTAIWNQLIQHHKESKLPFAVKTTQMFQSIQRTLAQHV
jgi:hypothetical protein